MPYTLPADVDDRSVAIVGAGTLGRRIALVYAAGGSDVRIFGLSAEQREAARDYVEVHVADVQQQLGLHPDRRGRVEVLGDLQEAVAGEEIEERFAGHLDEEEIRTVRRAMRKVIRASGEEPLSKGTND
jgi:threonine dehydrogenase-like Zn-dependent dehydrogenase